MKKSLKAISLCFVLTGALAVSVSAEDNEIKAAEYLSEYYNVAPFTDAEATVQTVSDAVTALGGEALASEELDICEVIQAGIRIAGLDELALTYVNEAVPDKAADVLAAAELEVPEEYAPYVACAVDLIEDASDLPGLEQDDDDDDADDAYAIESFLYRCAEIGGKGRHYIGRIDDDNMMSVLGTSLNSFTLFDDETLTEVGKEIVLSGATTGYNLKYAGCDASFLADYTLRYGHSDYTHAVQLIGLLQSEHFDGYVQVEPKVSVYEYMTDWGDPGDPTPTYAVREADEGRYLCYAVEYDLAIEFDTLEEKEKFHNLIETYAKKYDNIVDEDGNPTTALLAGSWWQPLYSSLTALENDEFGELTDNVIYSADGQYVIHSFSVPEKAADVSEAASKIAPDLTVGENTIYVNPAFIRYITGEDHQ